MYQSNPHLPEYPSVGVGTFPTLRGLPQGQRAVLSPALDKGKTFIWFLTSTSQDYITFDARLQVNGL